MSASRRAWTVRPKNAHDAAAVVGLLADVAREGTWIATEWPFDVAERAEAMRTAILGMRIVGWCAVDAGEIVGDLTVHGTGHDEPEIGVMVAASHRHRGIGRALIESAVAWGRNAGKSALRLRVFPDNVPALALYRATGFVELARTTTIVPSAHGAPRDAIVMRRALSERE